MKFYEDITLAIRDVVSELHKHTDAQYLRREFYAIQNKIDNAWPHAAKLKSLLHDNTSLDKIFSALCVPVLLTYDSDTTCSNQSYCQTYVDALTAEMRTIHRRFAKKQLPPVRIHLFLIPTATKSALVAKLDDKLKTWQRI